MRRVGVVAAVVLMACLCAVVVAVFGGPQAPFARFVAPGQVPTSGGASPPTAGDRAATPSPTAQLPGAPATIAAPSPVTNPAGHVPAGLARSPNPHKSSHGA